MSSDIFFFFNGIIITVDENFSIFNSFAFLDGKILSVGTKSDVEIFLEKNYPEHSIKERDLLGKTVVPGFIDSHMHLVMGIYFKTQIQLTNIKSFEQLKNAFEKVIPSKNNDEWILGLDFLEQKMSNPKERRFPTITELDDISLTHPIVIMRHDGHSCFTNSRGLELIGLSKETLHDFKTDSGRVETDDQGNPTGVLTEAATSFVIDHIPTPNFDIFMEAGLKYSEEMASLGITTLGVIVQTTEEGPSGKTGSFEFPIMQMLIRENKLLQDYVFYMITSLPKKLVRYKKNIEKLDNGRNQFVIGGIKRFFDGSIGSRTAYLSSPFTDGPPNNYGYLVHKEEELFEQLKLANKLGFHLICHAIGDKANRVLVDIYKKIKEQAPNSDSNPVMRIEHASILTEQLLKDIRDTGIMISSQPAFIESEYSWLRLRLGEERSKLTYPFKSIMEKGIVLAGASDSPVENPNILNAISITMHRHNFIPEECLTVHHALKMFTINAAISLGQGNIKGSLEIGKYADFVILDRDILESNAKEIKKIEVLETYRRGTRIFEKK